MRQSLLPGSGRGDRASGRSPGARPRLPCRRERGFASRTSGARYRAAARAARLLLRVRTAHTEPNPAPTERPPEVPLCDAAEGFHHVRWSIPARRPAIDRRLAPRAGVWPGCADRDFLAVESQPSLRRDSMARWYPSGTCSAASVPGFMNATRSCSWLATGSAQSVIAHA
jgi:hypothetical protein